MSSLQYVRSENPKGVFYVIDHLFDYIHLFCLLKRGDMQSLENFLWLLRLHHRISMIGWHMSQNELLQRFCDRRPVPVPFFLLQSQRALNREQWAKQ